MGLAVLALMALDAWNLWPVAGWTALSIGCVAAAAGMLA